MPSCKHPQNGIAALFVLDALLIASKGTDDPFNNGARSLLKVANSVHTLANSFRSVVNWFAKMKEFDGWPIYKIILGTPDDLAIVRELRRHADAVFRLDANTAWTAEQTLALAPELKR